MTANGQLLVETNVTKVWLTGYVVKGVGELLVCHNLVKWGRTNISSERFWSMLTANRKRYYAPRDELSLWYHFYCFLFLNKTLLWALKWSPVINFKGSGTGCGGSRVISKSFLSVIFHVRIFISMHWSLLLFNHQRLSLRLGTVTGRSRHIVSLGSTD